MSPRTAARAVRLFVRGPGRHRPGSTPALVPVIPIPPAPHGVLDEAELAQLIADEDIEANDYAYCGTCRRHTIQRTTRTGRRACWHCAPLNAGETA